MLPLFLGLAVIILTKANGKDGTKVRIQSLQVTSDIRSRFATTLITTKVLNPNPKPVEAFFVMNLPNSAFISNFSMNVDGKIIVGEVKEKVKARRQFERAKERGETSGLVSGERRHKRSLPWETDKFQISVNVAAHSKAYFNLTYQEILQRVHGVYRSVINIAPGQVVEDMKIDVYITETRPIINLRIPKIEKETAEKTNEELLKLKDTPDVDKTESKSGNATKTHISYHLPPEKQKGFGETGVVGQLVVLYDVERKDDAGEIQVVNGYFVHFFAPPNLPVGAKHVVFVLDKSGSMSGDKLTQVKKAMGVILNDLKDIDYFNVVVFSSSAESWSRDSKIADEANRKSAIEYINKLEARGSTELNVALKLAFNGLKNSQTGQTLARMIIALTDGLPNGINGSQGHILEDIKKLNQESIVSFHGIAFGDDTDFDFIRKLSAQNNGVARKVYLDSDPTLQLKGFYDEISSPLLTNIKIKYINETVDPETLVQDRESTYYDGSEIVTVGKLKPEIKDKDINLKGSVSGLGSTGERSFDIIRPIHCWERCSPTVRGAEHRAKRDDPFPCPLIPDCVITQEMEEAEALDPYSVGGFVERMWAYLTIKKLLNQAKYKETETGRQKELKEKALDLSLKYGFVTELTSMVVTKPDEEKQTRDKRQTRGNRGGPAGMPFAAGRGGGGGRGGRHSASSASSSSADAEDEYEYPKETEYYVEVMSAEYVEVMTTEPYTLTTSEESIASNIPIATFKTGDAARFNDTTASNVTAATRYICALQCLSTPLCKTALFLPSLKKHNCFLSLTLNIDCSEKSIDRKADESVLIYCVGKS